MSSAEMWIDGPNSQSKGEKNVGLWRIVQNELDQPVKIISNHTISNGLCSDHKEDSDFFIFSDKTKEFNDYFANNKLTLDANYWMSFFDKQEQEGKSTDGQARGFVNGHADIGWGREGVSKSAIVSQRGNQHVVCGSPRLIHKDKFDYQKLGNLPDQIQLLADKYIFDNGEKLMPNKTMRDNVFGKELREKLGCKQSRFESFTVVRQLLGRKIDVDQVSYELELQFGFTSCCE